MRIVPPTTQTYTSICERPSARYDISVSRVRLTSCRPWQNPINARRCLYRFVVIRGIVSPHTNAQGRNVVSWHPGQGTILAPSRSSLRSFGSECAALKKVLMTLLGIFGAPIVIRRPGNCAPLTPSYAPVNAHLVLSCIVGAITSTQCWCRVSTGCFREPKVFRRRTEQSTCSRSFWLNEDSEILRFLMRNPGFF